MNTHADNTRARNSHSEQSNAFQLQSDTPAKSQFVDNRPEAIAQRKLQDSANSSPQVQELSGYQNKANESIQRKESGSSKAAGPIQAMFGRFAMGAGRAIGGSILAGGVNEGIRRGVDYMGSQNEATGEDRLQDPSLQNAASRVSMRHGPHQQGPVPATGHSMVGSAIESMDAHRSPNPIAEGAMEGPYGRSQFGRLLMSAPERVPQTIARGSEAVRNGVDFATADPSTQAVDLAGAGLDSLAEMDPIRAMGTAARTGADLASSEQRQRMLESGQAAVADSGQRLGAQVGSGMLLSAGLRAVPVIGPAASIANMGLTLGGAMMNAGNAADNGGSIVHHLEERTAARRNGAE